MIEWTFFQMVKANTSEKIPTLPLKPTRDQFNIEMGLLQLRQVPFPYSLAFRALKCTSFVSQSANS